MKKNGIDISEHQKILLRFSLKSIFCGLLCKIMKKVVQIVKNKNFLRKIESCPLKK